MNENKFIRSPFFYVGDKYKLLPQIIKEFPKNINNFIEPFCGGGSVFLNTEAKNYIINDIDSYMIQLHKYLMSFCKLTDMFWYGIINTIEKYNLSATFLNKSIPHHYKEEYPKTYFAQYNKESFYKLREDFNKDQSDMTLLYLLLIYGFNRMLRFNSKGMFNLPVGNVDFNNNVEIALNDYFKNVKYKNISLYNYDFEQFINSLELNKDDFVYLDPPYLITFSEYNKIWSEKDEYRLINLLDELNRNSIKFACSNILWHKNKYNAIFNNWAQKYNIVKIKSNYINYHDNKEKDSIEVLVKNY